MAIMLAPIAAITAKYAKMFFIILLLDPLYEDPRLEIKLPTKLIAGFFYRSTCLDPAFETVFDVLSVKAHVLERGDGQRRSPT